MSRPLLETLPFDQEIHCYDQAAAWARLVERGLRELRYRKRDDAPVLRELSLVDALPEPLHGYSVKVGERRENP